MKAKANEQLQELAEKALEESVVRISWQKEHESSEKNVTTMGSGFFADSDIILTNLHGVAGASTIIAEILATETVYTVLGVLAHNIKDDLVLLKVNRDGVPLTIGNSDTIQLDDEVCIVGHPQGEKGVAILVNIHSIQETSQHILFNETFQQGQSGSPLLNSLGEVIGIAVLSTAEISSFPNQSNPALSHAIPANAISSLLSKVGEMKPIEEWNNQPQIRGYEKALEGQTLLLERKLGDAMDCFNSALELNPDLIGTYCNRAAINIVTGDANKAIADCNKAIKLNPDCVEAYINRATANLSLNRYNKVLADCDVALKLNPNQVRAHLYKATVKLALDKYTEALAEYDKVLSLNPNAAETYFYRGNTKGLLKDFTGAVKDFDKAISINPDLGAYLNIYRSRGEAKYSLGDYAGAIEDYDKEIKQYPDDEDNYNSRGLAKNNYGKSKANDGEQEISDRLYKEAIDDFSQAIQINPEFEGYWNNRGIAKRYIKDYEGAIKDCDQAIRLNSKYNFAFYNRAFAKNLLGDTKSKADSVKLYKEAIDDYTIAIKLNPKDISAYSNRGHVNYLLGNMRAEHGDISTCLKYYQDSINDYTKTIKLDPKNSSAYNNRAWSRYVVGKIETEIGDVQKATKSFNCAIDDCNEAIQLEPNNPSSNTYHTRAVINAALSKYENAIEDFDETIRINPIDAIALFERGLAKQEIGEHEEAETDIAKAKELDPDVEDKVSNEQ